MHVRFIMANLNNPNPVDVPPPAKRQRRFSQYDKFLEIIRSLGNKYNSSLFVCLTWSNTGVTCTYCCNDSNLKGFFTSHKPCVEFNYTKLKNHCVQNGIHFKRITDPNVKQLHPHFITAQAQLNTTNNNNNNSNSDSNPVSNPILYTPLEKILKAMDLIHLHIKLGAPLSKVKPYIEFYDDRFIAQELGSPWYVDEILTSMNTHQKRLDHRDVLGVDGKGNFALALDGSSQSIRSVKIFDMK
eukprot:214874_1